MTDKYHIDFFNELSGFEQDCVLYSARAYLRVRELHNDKSFHKSVQKRYKKLFEKLDAQVGE